ncbi:heterokaryon incompatibility protein-domain-containing protein [Cercophora newfieldiana]|uniref:Heterokaryon incompatibility protein-domain-containing protein n=1 Tax=Cercophora newfieldiana TaxID=92897 RepID=A0AA40CRM0_9PEZI|nr:heterokaryon incompatibility protein-domain-containing protein [Cercophora newfieldiana]
MRLQYRPLDQQTREIRILTLQPGQRGDPIVCTLDKVSLGDNPDFESLSYCWGDRTDTRDIIVDDHVYAVTKNLEAALQRLRYETVKRRIWADAVCINQSDDVEKGHQVSLMQDIFKSATETILFIGDYVDEPAPSPHHLFDPDLPIGSQFGVESTFALVQKLAENHHIFYHESPYHKNGPILPKSVKLHHRCTHGILSLISQPWWSRIWTVQEAVLPSRSTVQYGSLQMGWDVFAAAARNVRQHLALKCCDVNWSPRCRAHRPPIASFHQKVSALVDRQSNPLPLENLLRSFRDRTATDPRDMVYGMLGLAHWETVQADIQPDYTLGVAETYASVVRKLVNLDGDLYPLGPHRFETETSPRRYGLPSWVPDYSMTSEWTSYLDLDTMSNCWSPCDLEAVHLESTNNPLVLEVSGIEFDNIIAVGGAVLPSPIDDILSRVDEWRELLQTLHDWQASYPPGDHSGTYEGLWWMLVCRGLLWAGTTSFEEGSHRIATMADKHRVERTITEMLDKGRKNVDIHLLYFERFFVTRRGYIGMASQNTRVGDTVHVLVGGRTPFVLRRVDPEGGLDQISNMYNYVSDAFVLGIMGGGLLPAPEEPEKLQSYRLV